MHAYRLSDLLDINIIQKMADAHYRSVGMPLGIIDAIDGSILVKIGWQDICVNFHRVNPGTIMRCRKSDLYIAKHLVPGEACHCKCKNGLWDIAIPIMVAGRHLATMFLGQFFYEGEAPDRDFFRDQARTFGFDVESYLEALERVPVFSREKVTYILEYNKALASFISDLAESALSRLKADEAIRESERKFRALFDQSYQFFGLLTINGIVLETNATSLNFLGIEKSDVIGKPLWETPWWTHSPELQKTLRRAVRQAAKGELVRFEATHPTPQGDIMYADVSIKPVTDDYGNVVLLIPEGRDITAHKRAEREKLKLQDQLLMAQKMESIGRLAGGVAHDFNNMLSIILGNTELALASVNPKDPLYAHLEEIEHATERSVDLTRQLLAFARKQEVTPKALDLNETVEEMLTMLRRLVGEEIELTWTPGRDLWKIKIDPTQVNQVLMNLTANARDSIQGVGNISIETCNLVADASYCASQVGLVPGEYVLMELSDDGCGMDRKTLANIFEPFFSTKEGEKGTGLGLATVYGIVKQNNGIINAYSEPGKGTTFKLCLPRYKGPVAGPEAEKAAEPVPRGRETVLLVEDEAKLLKMAQTMLLKLGYTVLVALTPSEALCLAKEHPGEIHLLITDVILPEMNGRELARQLRSLYPDLKLLFMSGYTANVITNRGILDKGMPFIQKPFSIKALADKIREILSHP